MSPVERVSPARLAEGDGATRPHRSSKQTFTSGLKKPDQKPLSGDEAMKESFPASDPPSFNAGTDTEPAPRAADIAADVANDTSHSEADTTQRNRRAGNLPIE